LANKSLLYRFQPGRINAIMGTWQAGAPEQLPLSSYRASAKAVKPPRFAAVGDAWMAQGAWLLHPRPGPLLLVTGTHQLAGHV